MNHLDFIMWMVLVPLFNAMARYYNVKTKILRNKNHVFEDLESGKKLVAEFVFLFFYFFMAYKLY